MKENKYYKLDDDLIILESEDLGYIKTIELRDGRLFDDIYPLKDKDYLFGISSYQEIDLKEFINILEIFKSTLSKTIDHLNYKIDHLKYQRDDISYLKKQLLNKD